MDNQQLTLICNALPRVSGKEQDALQDVLLSLFTKDQLQVLNERDRLHAYLRGAVKKRKLALQRREQRRRIVSSECQLLECRDNSEITLRAKVVHGVLERLRTRTHHASAQLLEWRFLDGLSVKAISEKLKKTPLAVSAQLQRAKKHFLNEWSKVQIEGGK